MVDNMELYNKLRSVPNEAKKPIKGGRLNGFTDINPMWRMKALTETFGPCGIGWWYEITDKHMEGSGDEVRAFVDINLYYQYEGQTSHAVPGTGGSSFLTKEKNGAYTSDECYKMALTDAISVAAKALGVGADVYYEKDRDKYTTTEEPKQVPRPQTRRSPDVMPGPMEDADGYYICKECGEIIKGVKNGDLIMPPSEVAQLAMDNFGEQLCYKCGRARMKARQVS